MNRSTAVCHCFDIYIDEEPLIQLSDVVPDLSFLRNCMPSRVKCKAVNLRICVCRHKPERPTRRAADIKDMCIQYDGVQDYQCRIDQRTRQREEYFDQSHEHLQQLTDENANISNPEPLVTL